MVRSKFSVGIISNFLEISYVQIFERWSGYKSFRKKCAIGVCFGIISRKQPLTHNHFSKRVIRLGFHGEKRNVCVFLVIIRFQIPFTPKINVFLFHQTWKKNAFLFRLSKCIPKPECEFVVYSDSGRNGYHPTTLT